MNYVGRTGTTITRDLDASTFSGLIAGDIAAIWCKGFVLDDCCRQSVESVLASADFRGRKDQTSVTTLGVPLGLLLSGAVTEADYTQRLDSFLRSCAFDNVAVSDYFGLLRTAIKKCGLNFLRASWQGVALAPLVFRVYESAGRLKPHIDRSFEPPIRHLCRTARLAVNIYMLGPDPDCGALELWDLSMPSASFDKIEPMPEHVQREWLGPPHIVIHPNSGDCVIFDAERIHAVSAVESGRRVTCSSFIGVDAQQRSFTLFA
jgi:hypothetical protein